MGEEPDPGPSDAPDAPDAPADESTDSSADDEVHPADAPESADDEGFVADEELEDEPYIAHEEDAAEFADEEPEDEPYIADDEDVVEFDDDEDDPFIADDEDVVEFTDEEPEDEPYIADDEDVVEFADEELEDDPFIADDEEGVVEAGEEADTDGGLERVPSHAPEPAVPGDDPEIVDPGDPLDPADEGTVDDGFLGEGPEHDEEMPLTQHIEEMMRRLGVVFLVAGAVTLAVFGLGTSPDLFGYGRYLEAIPSSTAIIDYLWNHNIPGAPEMADRRPRLYGPLELVLTELKVAGLAGLVVGLPVFVYETYLFMRPGLYRTERRYYLAAVPTSLVLALIGMAFAHFVVLPSLFAYFTSYTQRAVFVAFGLKETFNLILVLMGYMAVIFQIPLFVMLAVMMNLVTRRWMEDRRIIFWGVFATIAFFATPDPTGMAPIIVGATMIGLFEGTLALLRWTGN